MRADWLEVELEEKKAFCAKELSEIKMRADGLEVQLEESKALEETKAASSEVMLELEQTKEDLEKTKSVLAAAMLELEETKAASAKVLLELEETKEELKETEGLLNTSEAFREADRKKMWEKNRWIQIMEGKLAICPLVQELDLMRENLELAKKELRKTKRELENTKASSGEMSAKWKKRGE